MLLLVMAMNQCVDNNFSEPFKSCLGEDAVYNFFNGMT